MNESRVVRAAGIAVARPANGEWEFVLVRSRFTGDWGCAKGHCFGKRIFLEVAAYR
jgi:hypothetical protein